MWLILSQSAVEKQKMPGREIDAKAFQRGFEQQD